MTTSITDARFTSLHFTSGQFLSLDIDAPAETGWGVMPGYDESLEIPDWLEPPRMDADETLPNMLHPSYPFGRPSTGKGQGKGKGGRGGGLGPGGGVGNLMSGQGREEERWDELGDGLIEEKKGKEVPPGMAGAKRPPSPPSPTFRPGYSPLPRSSHLQNLLARESQQTPQTRTDPFDAPVPNETTTDERGEHRQAHGQAQGQGDGENGNVDRRR